MSDGAAAERDTQLLGVSKPVVFLLLFVMVAVGVGVIGTYGGVGVQAVSLVGGVGVVEVRAKSGCHTDL